MSFSLFDRKLDAHSRTDHCLRLRVELDAIERKFKDIPPRGYLLVDARPEQAHNGPRFEEAL